MVLLMDAGRLSVQAVLSLKLGETLMVRVLLLVGRVHVLVLKMVLMRMVGAHLAVCASLRCGMLHETWQRSWSCSLVVRKSCRVHGGAHVVPLIHLSHEVPTTSSHHTGLTHWLGFNFVSKRWRRGGHLVMSGSSWYGDRIQRSQLGVFPPVSRLPYVLR